jgi:hypothetical protein
MGKSIRTFIILLATVLAATSLSNAEPWKKSLDLGLNLTQNSYSDNWSGGEVGSVSWVSQANGTFERQFSPKFNFKNTTKLQFGQTHTQDENTKDWKKPIKSTDKIDIENVGRLRFRLGSIHIWHSVWSRNSSMPLMTPLIDFSTRFC